MEPSPSPSWIVASIESSRPLPSPSRTSSCGRSRRSKLVGPPSFLTVKNKIRNRIELWVESELPKIRRINRTEKRR
ncbi:hypothetical protein HanPSC8_Chr15g0652021 [Helianthus annuus]|nr:hypothetical protein HanPSC8_Chr15g0652021 [Helianthus annuus]